MALFPANYILAQGSLHYRLATLGYQKYNACSVEKCVLIHYLCHDSLEYHWKRITINSLIQTKKLFINHRRRRFYVNISMNVFYIMNITTIQRRIFYAGIPMDEFRNINALIAQRRRYYTIIPMNVFGNKNVLVVQRRRLYANIPINVSSIINALMVQLGTSCSFDSPGLVRDEPTPGKRS